MNPKDAAIFALAENLVTKIRDAENRGADQDVVQQALWMASTIYQTGLKKEASLLGTQMAAQKTQA